LQLIILINDQFQLHLHICQKSAKLQMLQKNPEYISMISLGEYFQAWLKRSSDGSLSKLCPTACLPSKMAAVTKNINFLGMTAVTDDIYNNIYE
jgi:hypothetical protein